MHELSLAGGVVDILVEEAARHGVGQIQSALLRVGRLREVVPELLETGFEVAARGTVAGGATLEVEQVPGQARCQACAREFPVDDLLIICPGCQAVGGDVIAGLELQLISFDGEEETS